MSNALVAAFKSQARSLIDKCHLDHDEVVRASLALALDHAPRAGLDRRGLIAMLDDALAARAVEGESGGEA